MKSLKDIMGSHAKDPFESWDDKAVQAIAKEYAENVLEYAFNFDMVTRQIGKKQYKDMWSLDVDMGGDADFTSAEVIESYNDPTWDKFEEE